MKKTKLVLMLVLAVFMLGETAQSKEASAPDTGQSVSGAKASAGIHSLSVSQYTGSGAVVSVTAVLLPVKLSPSWAAAASSTINDARNGTLHNTADYTTITSIVWQNLVYSESATWAGTIVWQVVDVRSSADDLSLDMIRMTSQSNNDGNSLGDALEFGGNSYTAQAIAIKSDGTVINSGSASQKGNRVIVLTQMKLFNGGATQSGLDEVRNWVNSFSEFKITYTATVGAYSGTAVLSTLVAPRLTITPAGMIGIQNLQSGRSYKIESRNSLSVGGSWSAVGIITDASPTLSVSNTAPIGFYRAVVQ